MENVVLALKENINKFCNDFGDGNFGDVMVVGRRSGGIQASLLDLATAGFKGSLV